MLKPADILMYTGAGLAAWLLFRGARSAARGEAATEKAKQDQERTREVQNTAEKFMLSWKDNQGRRRSANLDTMSVKLREALRGSWVNEDEEAVKQVMMAIPSSIKGPSGVSYPIRTIAARYAINTNGKNLKSDLVRLLSTKELRELGVNRHLIYL
jgi:hypothetical protein